MKHCQDCNRIEADGVCSRYGKKPPKNYAVKCQHFDGQEAQEPKQCKYVVSEGLCMRTDHPIFEYWFRPWNRCNDCDWKE